LAEKSSLRNLDPPPFSLGFFLLRCDHTKNIDFAAVIAGISPAQAFSLQSESSNRPTLMPISPLRYRPVEFRTANATNSSHGQAWLLRNNVSLTGYDFKAYRSRGHGGVPAMNQRWLLALLLREVSVCAEVTIARVDYRRTSARGRNEGTATSVVRPPARRCGQS